MAAPTDALAPLPSSGTLDSSVEKLLEEWRGGDVPIDVKGC